MARLSPDQTATAAGLRMVDPTNQAPSPDATVQKAREEMGKDTDKQKKETKPKITSIEEARREMQKLEHDKSEKAVKESIDDTLDAVLERDATGNPLKETKGADRLADATAGRQAAENFLELKGIDNLSPTELVEARAQVIESFAKQFGGKEAVDVLTTQGKLDAAIDLWLRNPDYRHNFRELAKELTNNPPPITELQQRIDDAKTRLIDARTAYNEKNNDYAAAETRNANASAKVQAELSQFEPEVVDVTGTVIKPAGPKSQEIANQKADMATNKPAYDGDRAALEAIVRPLGIRYENGGLVYTKEQMKQLKDMGILKDVVSRAKALSGHPYEVAMRTRDGLLAEQTKLQQESERLNQERVRLVTDLAASSENMGNAEQALTDAKDARGKVEDEYSQKWKNLFGEAMDQTMAQEQGYMDAAANARHAEGAEHEHDPIKKAIHEASGENGYWGGIRVKRNGLIENKLNEKHIEGHMKLLTTTDRLKVVESFINPATGKNYTQAEIGAAILADPAFLDTFGKNQPEAIMRHLVMSRVNPDTGRNFTLAEVNTLIAHDPDSYKDLPGQIAKDLLKKAIATKKLNTDQINMIANDPDWGGEHFVHELMHDPDVVKKMEELKSKGIAFDASWAKDKRSWGIMVAAFLLGGLPGAALYFGIKSVGRRRAPAAAGGH